MFLFFMLCLSCGQSNSRTKQNTDHQKRDTVNRIPVGDESIVDTKNTQPGLSNKESEASTQKVDNNTQALEELQKQYNTVSENYNEQLDRWLSYVNKINPEEDKTKEYNYNLEIYKKEATRNNDDAFTKNILSCNNPLGLFIYLIFNEESYINLLGTVQLWEKVADILEKFHTKGYVLEREFDIKVEDVVTKASIVEISARVLRSIKYKTKLDYQLPERVMDQWARIFNCFSYKDLNLTLSINGVNRCLTEEFTLMLHPSLAKVFYNRAEAVEKEEFVKKFFNCMRSGMLPDSITDIDKNVNYVKYIENIVEILETFKVLNIPESSGVITKFYFDEYQRSRIQKSDGLMLFSYVVNANVFLPNNYNTYLNIVSISDTDYKKNIAYFRSTDLLIFLSEFCSFVIEKNEKVPYVNVKEIFGRLADFIVDLSIQLDSPQGIGFLLLITNQQYQSQEYSRYLRFVKQVYTSLQKNQDFKNKVMSYAASNVWQDFNISQNQEDISRREKDLENIFRVIDIDEDA